VNTHGSEPAVRLTLPQARATAVIEALADPRPLVQSLMLPHGVTEGHWYTAGLNSHGRLVGQGETRVDVYVASDGHWWLNTDPGLGTTCRGCGGDGDFVGTFAARCPRAATAQDIACALLADYPRPAPVAPRALYAGVSA